MELTALVSGASVTFEPGPRMAWHTHLSAIESASLQITIDGARSPEFQEKLLGR